MLEYEIEAFGHRLGLDGLALSPAGLARLDIENVGSLYLEQAEECGHDELLVYLAVPLPAHDGGATRRLLELCNYRHGFPWPVSAAEAGGRALLLTRMEESAVTAAALENVLRFLSELMREVF